MPPRYFRRRSPKKIRRYSDFLEEEAGTGNWLDGMRFRSSASEDDVKSWVDGLEK